VFAAPAPDRDIVFWPDANLLSRARQPGSRITDYNQKNIIG
jgi:hypothetical protein